MDLPIENQRLKDVINHTCNGNISKFSNEIGVSQPRISRLFSIDRRSGRYPTISFDILQATINKFIFINSEWLITGKGEMLKDTEIVVSSSCDKQISRLLELLDQKDEEIDQLKKERESDSYYGIAADPKPELKKDKK